MTNISVRLTLLSSAATLALWSAVALAGPAPAPLIIVPDEEREPVPAKVAPAKPSAPAKPTLPKKPSAAVPAEPEIFIDGIPVPPPAPAPAPAKLEEKAPEEPITEKKMEEVITPPPAPEPVEEKSAEEKSVETKEAPLEIEPVEETPEEKTEHAPLHEETIPQEPFPEAEPVVTVTPGIPTDSPIAVGQIETITASTVGTLADAQGGLGIDMWKNSMPETLAQLFPRIPSAVRSPTMRDLRQRLLLTRADVPKGSDARLSDLRLRLLLETGDMSAIDQLIPLIPRTALSDEIDRVRVESLWQRYDYEGACAYVRDAIARHDSIYWRRQLIFCQAKEGEDDAAQLGLDLLSEQNQLKDPMLLQVLDALMNDKPMGKLTIWPVEPVPSTIAMLAEAKAEMPEEALKKSSPMLAAMIARYPGAPDEIRISAAEHAATDGALDVAVLRGLYESVKFSDKERGAAKDKPESYGGPRGRALLYQNIWPHYDMQGTAKLIALSRSLYDAAGLPGLADWLYVPKVQEVSQSSYSSNRLPWFTNDAFGMLAANSDGENMRQWIDIAERTDKTSPFAIARPALLRLLRGETSGTFSAPPAGPVATPEQAALLNRCYSLLEALGVTIPAEQWRTLLIHLPPVKGSVLPTAWKEALLDAALQGRRGEVVMLALLALGDQRPGDLSDSSIAALVKALHSVGLDKDARRLAIEAFGTWGA